MAEATITPVQATDANIDALLVRHQWTLRDATALAERINSVAPVLAALEKLKRDDRKARQQYTDLTRQFKQVDESLRRRILAEQIGEPIEVSNDNEHFTGVLLELWNDKALVEPDDDRQQVVDVADVMPLTDHRYCPGLCPPEIIRLAHDDEGISF
ncbi:MAG: hypothetical protein RIC55_08070 [Pirellulaceae bacterium]